MRQDNQTTNFWSEEIEASNQRAKQPGMETSQHVAISVTEAKDIETKPDC
jgi:hypothetical protein